VKPYGICPCHRRLIAEFRDEAGVMKGVCALTGLVFRITEYDLLGLIEGGKADPEGVSFRDDPPEQRDDNAQTQA
jgi:hypothetical protein